MFALNDGRALRVIVRPMALPSSTCTSIEVLASKRLRTQSSEAEEQYQQVLYATQQPQKGAKGIASVCAHWDSYLLRAALSSVSKQATKTAKNQPFLSISPLGLCGTVASNKEASKLHLRILV